MQNDYFFRWRDYLYSLSPASRTRSFRLSLAAGRTKVSLCFISLSFAIVYASSAITRCRSKICLAYKQIYMLDIVVEIFLHRKLELENYFCEVIATVNTLITWEFGRRMFLWEIKIEIYKYRNTGSYGIRKYIKYKILCSIM